MLKHLNLRNLQNHKKKKMIASVDLNHKYIKYKICFQIITYNKLYILCRDSN